MISRMSIFSGVGFTDPVEEFRQADVAVEAAVFDEVDEILRIRKVGRHLTDSQDLAVLLAVVPR